MNTTQTLTEKVNKFLELHEAQATLKKEADKLKKELRDSMEGLGVTSLEGEHGSIKLQTSIRGLGKFEDYNLAEVMQVLKGDDLKQVTEIKVNSTKVNGLVKLGRLTSEQVQALEEMKNTKQVTSLVVKR